MIGLTRFKLLTLVGICLTCGGCQKDLPEEGLKSSSQDGSGAAQEGAFDFQALQGEWMIAESNGVAWEGTVCINDEFSYQWQTPRGSSIAVVFEPSDLSPTGLVHLTFESAEDNVTLGGGGPRKGVARRLANGDVEIIVSPSAGHDFPSDSVDAVPELTLRRP